MRIRFLQETTGNFGKAVLTPSPGGNPRPGMDTDQKSVRRNAQSGEIRLSRSQFAVCQAEMTKLTIHRHIYCLEQMQPDIGSVRARQVRRDLVSQEGTPAPDTVPDSSPRTGEPEHKVVAHIHSSRKGPVPSALA